MNPRQWPPGHDTKTPLYWKQGCWKPEQEVRQRCWPDRDVFALQQLEVHRSCPVFFYNAGNTGNVIFPEVLLRCFTHTAAGQAVHDGPVILAEPFNPWFYFNRCTGIYPWLKLFCFNVSGRVVSKMNVALLINSTAYVRINWKPYIKLRPADNDGWIEGYFILKQHRCRSLITLDIAVYRCTKPARLCLIQ